MSRGGPGPGGVPFVDLAAPLDELGAQIDGAIRRVVRSAAYILGPEVSGFEEEMATYCGARFGIGVDSGTSALELILRSLGIGPGDEVVTAANSFVATAMSISHTGATPVFVDVDRTTKTITASHVEPAISRRTRAIVPVHLYGHPADMEPIVRLAERHGLAVVEDACQAHGARYRGRPVGSLGTAAAFSFYPSKNLGALGDGGMVVTSDEQVARTVRRLRSYGEVVKNRSSEVGYNKRLDELQAAVLRVKLRHLDRWNAQRVRAAAAYARSLDGLHAVALPSKEPWAEPVWHLYVLQVPDRDRVRHELALDGIETGVHYPIPIPRQPAYGGAVGQPFPVSDQSAEACLSLPMFPQLTSDAVERVAASLRRSVPASVS